MLKPYNKALITRNVIKLYNELISRLFQPILWFDGGFQQNHTRVYGGFMLLYSIVILIILYSHQPGIPQVF